MPSSTTTATGRPLSVPMPDPPSLDPLHTTADAHNALVPSPAHPDPPDSPTPTSAYDFPPSYYRNAVNDVHGVLYGGRGKSRDDIEATVRRFYSAGAAFENPLTLARGKESIEDMFALLALVPGTMWSEMGDITESQGYDGNRLLVFTHTLHISLLPFLDTEAAPHLPGTTNAAPSLRRSYSFFSLPSTPYPQTPSATQASIDFGDEGQQSPGIFSKTHPAFLPKDGGLAQSLFALLNPKAIASALTTLHLKIHTRLLFNEDGRIVGHEDVWGVKEIVEGVFPLVGHLYAVNRQGLAWAAGLASRTLLGGRRPPSPSSSRAIERSADDEQRDLEAGKGAKSFRTPESFRREMKALHPALSAPYPLPPPHPASMLTAHSLESYQAPKTPLGSNGLGLVDEPVPPSPAAIKAVPTTMIEE